jgi:acylglycerol lipase
VLQIADKVKPPPLVVAILIKLANIIPTWKIVPTKDIIANAIKDPEKRKEVRSDVLFPGLKFCNTLIMTLL